MLVDVPLGDELLLLLDLDQCCFASSEAARVVV
jgi:hypothetical protein